jgi:hypothetical protein
MYRSKGRVSDGAKADRKPTEIRSGKLLKKVSVVNYMQSSYRPRDKAPESIGVAGHRATQSGENAVRLAHRLMW